MFLLVLKAVFALVGVALMGLYLRYRRWLSEFPSNDPSFLAGTFYGSYKAAKEERDLEWNKSFGRSEVTQMILPLGLSRVLVVSNPRWVDFITTANLPKAKVRFFK